MKISLKISWGCHPTAHRNEGTCFSQVISGITALVFLFCLKQSGGDIGHITYHHYHICCLYLAQISCQGEKNTILHY